MGVKAKPDGYHTATPYLHIKGAAEAIEFYKKAFGATELLRMEMTPGVIGHAEIKIGDSILMMSDECPQSGNKSPATLGGTTRQLSAPSQFVEARVGLNLISDPTGGKAFVDQSDLASVLREVDQDSRMRYFITYKAPKHDKKKKVKRYEIDVKVKRPDVKVRARDSYLD